MQPLNMRHCISYGKNGVSVYAPAHFIIDSVYAPAHNNAMLEQIRKQRELTQEQLAEKSGVDQTTISRLERGDIKRPRWEVVANLAKALGVKPEKLFPTNAA
jgi:DNA-binding XRE family transcriptional regulator